MLKFELDQEYQCLLKKQSLMFAKDRTWDSVSSVLRFDGDSSSFEQFLIKDGIPDASGEAAVLTANPLEQPFWRLLDALPEIRQQMLSTDAKQFSGLMYTLYPDGTFRVDYDFNQQEATGKPVLNSVLHAEQEDYEQLDAQFLSQVAMEERGFLQRCRDELVRKNHQAQQSWGLGNESLCDVDLALGMITLNIADDIVLRDIQVVGSFNPEDLSFKWSSVMPEVPVPLQYVARQVYSLASQQYYPSLMQAVLQCNEEEAWNFAAVACHVSGAEGAYRVKANGEWLYVVFFAGEEDELFSLTEQ